VHDLTSVGELKGVLNTTLVVCSITTKCNASTKSFGTKNGVFKRQWYCREWVVRTT